MRLSSTRYPASKDLAGLHFPPNTHLSKCVSVVTGVKCYFSDANPHPRLGNSYSSAASTQRSPRGLKSYKHHPEMASSHRTPTCAQPTFVFRPTILLSLNPDSELFWLPQSSLVVTAPKPPSRWSFRNRLQARRTLMQ